MSTSDLQARLAALAPRSLAQLFAADGALIRRIAAHGEDTKRDAWLGDAVLHLLVSEKLFTSTQFNKGELSRLRCRYEANATLAWFLTHATDLQQYIGDSSDLNIHTLGTFFEALLHHAPAYARTAAIDTLMSWVDARHDSRLVCEVHSGVFQWRWADVTEPLSDDDVRRAHDDMSLGHVAEELACICELCTSSLNQIHDAVGIHPCLVELEQAVSVAVLLEQNQSIVPDTLVRAMHRLIRRCVTGGGGNGVSKDSVQMLHELGMRRKATGANYELIRRIFEPVNRAKSQVKRLRDLDDV